MKLLLLSGLALLSLFFQKSNDDLKASIARGQEVYTNNCISCHMNDGKGLPQAFPPLAQSDFLTKSPHSAIKVVKYGLSGPIEVNGVTYDSMMPEPGLSDDEVADVMNYILNSWENSSEGKMITVEMVQEIKRDE